MLILNKMIKSYKKNEYMGSNFMLAIYPFTTLYSYT